MDDTRSGDDTGEELDDTSSQSLTPPPPNLPSSSRQMRNQAEKIRRDKLNQFITELSQLVPMVAASAKRLDKTSILRLSATFLRMHQIFIGGKKSLKTNIPMNWCQAILEGMEGMLLVVTSAGKIVFISHNVESILGHQQNDLLGQSLFNITSLEDHEELKKNLRPDEDEVNRPSTSTEISVPGNVAARRPQRCSFYLRLRQRAASRSDQPQYELVHVMGHLRIPHTPPGNKQRDPPMPNDVVLVAMVKPFKDKRITENSLLEATREEWITRHLIDGTIVFADHRISVVSGYMSEEVTGRHAFRYMHKDDVRWVMIVLRQMYYRGQSYGCSCYRLLSKTGEFIYIRTHGYLELGEDSNCVQSFICINSLVSPEEGEKHIAQMKALFTPLVRQRPEPGISGLAKNHILTDGTFHDFDDLNPTVEDPVELEEAIRLLLADLPTDQIKPVGSCEIPDQQYAKVTMVSKTMPPVSIQSSRVGVTPPSLTKSQRVMRPSVITRSEKRFVEEPSTSAKKLRPEETSVIVARCSQGVTTEPLLTDRDLQDEVGNEEEPPSPLRADKIKVDPLGANFLQSQSRLDIFFSPEILPNDPLETTPDFRAHLPVDSLDSTLPLSSEALDILGSNVSTFDEGILREHMKLEGDIELQQKQISNIEEELYSVSMSTIDTPIFKSKVETITQLKAEHKIHQQMLKTLQQDHQNIQQCKDNLPLRGSQDIGV